MSDFFTWVLSLFAIIFTFLSTFAIFFASISTWYGFKYRRDANINLRRETHFNISDGFNKFINNLNDKDKILSEGYDLKLLAYFSSPLSKKRRLKKIKVSSTKTNMKYLLLKQFREWEKIEDDFYIKKNLKFSDFNKKFKLINDGKKIEDKNELIKILTVILLVICTESIDLIKNIEEYSKLEKYISSLVSQSKKQFARYIKIFSSDSKISKEEASKLENEFNKLVESENINTEEFDLKLKSNSINEQNYLDFEVFVDLRKL